MRETTLEPCWLQGNNPRRDEGLRSDLPLYHNGEMDEAEPDMEEIEFRTTGLVQEEGEPGEAGRSRNPCDQSRSPFLPIPGSQGVGMQPEHILNRLACFCHK
jgi:hypothetical protein